MAREQRKLAAILAVDVVGYSRLMGRDESGTLSRLREHRKLRLEPAIARYNGRLVKLMGDGALVDFASAVDALSAAIEIQQAVADANSRCAEFEQIVFRMGLHLGDLIVDGDDLYGDGINIAGAAGDRSAGRRNSRFQPCPRRRSRPAQGVVPRPWSTGTQEHPAACSII